MNALTPSQELALKARGNVLVVAGAGTGKTRTLVERCLSMVQAGCAWDEILVVTFTEAAAAEMRARIRSRLLATLAEGEGSPHLQEQLALLDTARISTLHSFCLNLVREHFYHAKLRLDPQFAVLSVEQVHQLQHQALETMLDKQYGGGGEEAAAFRQWLARQARGEDHRVREWIWRVHRYSQSLPDPEHWLERQARLLGQPEPGQWRTWFAEGLAAWRNQWLPVLERQPAENTPAAICLKGLAAWKDAKGGVSLADGASVLKEVAAADSDENWPPRKKTALRGPLKKFFEEAEFLCSLLPVAGSDDPLLQDWEWTRHEMLVLLRLTGQFASEFSRAKREAGGVDFADLEQFALRLLWDREKAARTPLAAEWQAGLKHLFVDEYQDINAAQDMILRALSRDDAVEQTGDTPSPAIPGNRFLVGDVKQSIYRFRLAEPAIFQGYKADWQENRAKGQTIFLSDNFRSREALLDFINPLFASLMRKDIGGVDYDSAAHLAFGAPSGRGPLSRAADARPKVELHLRRKDAQDDISSGDDELGGQRDQAELADLEETEKEARMVALRLRELRDRKEQIWDGQLNRFRAVEWRDMVVLLRAPAGKVESYAKQFDRAGVPLHAARGGFYEAPEISDLLALLHLLDNPLQDLPVLAVLRSPLAGLSLDELAAVRAASPKDCFWVALQKFSRTRRGSDSSLGQVAEAARGKTQAFLEQFEAWRQRARQGSLADCLEVVLAETHYEELLLAQPRGEERLANAQRFLKLARRFDPYQRQGLFRFLQFVETQREAEAGETPAPPATLDAVRLLSIHQSKGLEFPVVVAADLGKSFNLSDLRADFLIDTEYGICPRVTPPGGSGHYPSLPYWLARRRQLLNSLGEEMRLLYVALTRAKDRLILAGSTGDDTGIERWRHEAVSAAIPAEQILSARSYWGWLQLWLNTATQPGDWKGESDGENSFIQWILYSANDARLLDPEKWNGTTTGLPRPAPSAIPQAVIERVTWNYPFTSATSEPAKTSVTAQRRRAQELQADEDSYSLFDASSPGRGAAATSKPGSLSAAARGNAHHKFLQFISLDKRLAQEELRLEAARLHHEQILTAEELASLDFEGLAAFWSSKLGREVIAHAGCTRRELQFTARFSPGELEAAFVSNSAGPASEAACIPANTLSGKQVAPTNGDEDELVVLQGVADLAVLLPKEIWLVDFKTDEFSADELAEKIGAYEPQLRLYAQALQRIYQRPVTECCLYFLSRRTSASVQVSS